MILRIYGLLASIGLIVFLNLAQASVKVKQIESQEWWTAESENFTVISDQGEEFATELALRLEKFKKTFALFYRHSLPAEMRRIKVFSTDHYQIFDTLFGRRYNGTSGVFYDRRAGHYAIMRGGKLDATTRDQSATSVLYHEYTHYLEVNLSEVDLPFWYSEGLAEYLSTLKFEEGDKIVYGLPVEYHQRRIKYETWIPMKILMRGTRGSLGGKLYSRIYPQGWLMVHYFQSEMEKQQRLLKFFEYLDQGASAEEAVNKGLNVTFLELDRELKAYAKTRRLPYSVVSLENGWNIPKPEAKRLQTSEILAEVGRFLISRGVVYVEGEAEIKGVEEYRGRAEVIAKDLFERALELNPEEPVALPGLAFLTKKGDPNAAMPSLDKALALPVVSSDSYSLEGERQVLLMSQATDESVKLEHRKKAVRAFNKAIKLDGENVQAMASAASLYAFEEKWETAAALLEGAVSIAPSNSSLRKELILVNLNSGNLDAAEHQAAIIRRDAHLNPKSKKAFEDWYVAAGGKPLKSDGDVKDEEMTTKVKPE